MNLDEKTEKEILVHIEDVLKAEKERDAMLLRVCRILAENVDHYDWVGFYLVNPDAEKELVLGPFVGDETEHTRIGFGKGICGQAAETRELFLVPDVDAEDNYLSCSPEVRSEIVLPIISNGELIGELDIDSHQKDPFGEADTRMLKTVCIMLSDRITL